MGPSGKKVLYLNNISMDMCLLPSSVLCVCLDLNCCSTTALRCSTSQQLPSVASLILSMCENFFEWFWTFEGGALFMKFVLKGTLTPW